VLPFLLASASNSQILATLFRIGVCCAVWKFHQHSVRKMRYWKWCSSVRSWGPAAAFHADEPQNNFKHFFFKRISHCDIPWHVKHIIWKYIIYLDIFRLADWPCWPAGSWTFTRCTELWQIGYAWLWCIAPCTDCVEHPFKANYQLGRRTDRKGERKAELID